MQSPKPTRIVRLLAAAALAAAAFAAPGCLPAYDPDEVTLTPGNNSSSNNSSPGNNNPSCTGGQEICDGADNDCDGTIDEDFPRRGIPCGNNLGVCAAVTICEGGQEVCYAIVEPTGEICDGLDNDCDGQEDELTDSDPNNCGACGNVCSFANGVAGCQSGRCVLMGCESGFEDCDQEPSTGCETNTSSDPVNCGACGSICGDDSAVTTCQSGTCAIQSCQSGRIDCNNFALDGCEADTTVDIFNCGQCGMRCEFDNAVAQCIDEACAFTACNDGFADSDLNSANGCEVGLRVQSSPPDAGLSNLTTAGNLLYGSSGSQLFGYELNASGAIGALRFSWTAPSPIRQLNAGSNSLYMALDAGDVYILDTTNPDMIQTEGVVVTSGAAPGFARTGATLYIADGRDGLRVVDVSDAARPRLVGRAASSGPVNYAFTSGTRVILSGNGRADMDIFDVSDPARPTRLGTFETVAPFDQALVSGDLIVTARRADTRVQIYRFSEDNQLTFLGSSDLPGRLAAIEQRYPFLLAVVGNPGQPLSVLTIDIRRPQRPATTNTFTSSVPNAPSAAAFAETQLYAAGDGGLQRIDISDLRRPVGAQDLVRPQTFNDLAIRQNRLYVAADGALEVLDLNNPQSPTRVARFGDQIQRIALSDAALFVTGQGGATVSAYTLGGLSENPTPFATFNGDAGLPLDLEPSPDNTHVYLLYANTLHVVRIMPDASLLVGSVDLGTSCRTMIRQESFLYAACNDGVAILNVAVPEAPTVAVVGTGSALYDVDLVSNTTLYALNDNGITILGVNVPGSLTLRNAVSFEGVAGLRRMTSIDDGGLWTVASSDTQALLIDSAMITSPRYIVSRNLGASVVELVTSADSVYAGTAGGVFRLAVEGPSR